MKRAMKILIFTFIAAGLFLQVKNVLGSFPDERNTLDTINITANFRNTTSVDINEARGVPEENEPSVLFLGDKKRVGDGENQIDRIREDERMLRQKMMWKEKDMSLMPERMPQNRSRQSHKIHFERAELELESQRMMGERTDVGTFIMPCLASENCYRIATGKCKCNETTIQPRDFEDY